MAIGGALAVIAAAWAKLTGKLSPAKSEATDLSGRLDDIEDDHEELRRDLNGLAQRTARIEGRLNL